MKAVIGILVGISVVLGIGVAFQQSQISELKDAVGDTPTERRSKDARAAPMGEDELALRVAALEKRVVQLQRVAVARANADPGELDISDEDAEAYETEIDQIKEDLNALITGQALDTDEGRARLRAAVREEQEAAMDDRRKEWRDRMREEQDHVLKEFAQDQNLSDEQYEQMTAATQDARGKMEKLWEDVRAGDVRMVDARKEMGALRDEHDGKMESILDSDQYTAYQEMREEQRGGRRGGW